MQIFIVSSNEIIVKIESISSDPIDKPGSSCLIQFKKNL